VKQTAHFLRTPGGALRPNCCWRKNKKWTPWYLTRRPGFGACFRIPFETAGPLLWCDHAGRTTPRSERVRAPPDDVSAEIWIGGPDLFAVTGRQAEAAVPTLPLPAAALDFPTPGIVGPDGGCDRSFLTEGPGLTKLRLARNRFSFDSSRFHYSIREAVVENV